MVHGKRLSQIKTYTPFRFKTFSILGCISSCLYLQKQNSQQTGVYFDENQWTLVSPNIIPFQNDDRDCGVFACISAFNAMNIKYNKYQENRCFNVEILDSKHYY